MSILWCGHLACTNFPLIAGWKPAPQQAVTPAYPHFISQVEKLFFSCFSWKDQA